MNQLESLSPTETEVLRLLASGLTVLEIAPLRHRSVPTIRAQVKSVLQKLDVHSSLTAVALYHRYTCPPPCGEA